MPFPQPRDGGGGGAPSFNTFFASNSSTGTNGGRAMEMDPEAVSHVWIPDSQTVWRLARLDYLTKDMASVHVPGIYEDAFQVPRKDTRVWDPSHSLYLEDAAKLNSLHEAALLSLLHTRFCNDDIYTYTGDVLISVNPYKTIPLLYQMPDDTSKAIYKRVTSGEGRLSQAEQLFAEGAEDDEGEQEGLGGQAPAKVDTVLDHPHVYSIADKAHRFMTDPQSNNRLRCRDQSIIITGESGAGKTEAAKYVMKYLIAASQAVDYADNEGTVTPAGGKGGFWREGGVGREGDMEQCLLESTVILEAFGNAKTVRNDNSSRFGKYIKLQYASTWRLKGARTLPFLLEKSRLVHQEKDERNYHVFYQMCKGLPEELREEFKLGEAVEYEMLSHGGNFLQSEEVDDAEEFRTLNKALDVLGLTEEQQSGLWRVLSALLHLGNIMLIDEDEGNDAVCVAHLESPVIPVMELSEMVGLPAGLLVSSIRTKKAFTGRGSLLEIPLNATQAKDNLHALIKHIYGQIFAWLVGQINQAHGGSDSEKGEDGPVAFIGILDIFGFEIMMRNSFEQLCINFANEVLQQQFNSQVFVLEQEEYKREGLDWTVIQFKDNQPVIDLIARKPLGLLIQLEEQGMLGRRANNKALLQLYHNTHLGKNKFYSKPRFDSMEFIVVHFAGEVVYDAEGFLEKNNDSLHDNLLDLLDATSNSFLRSVIEFVDSDSSSSAEVQVPGQGLLARGLFPQTPRRDRGGGEEDAANNVPYAPLPLSPLSPMVGPGGRSTGNGSPFSFTGQSPKSQSQSPAGNFSGVGELSPALSPSLSPTLSPASRANQRKVGSRQGNKLVRNAALGVKDKVSQIATTVTVSRAFRGQLLSLMATLRATEPHYIKCIKPNNVKAPGGFSSHLVHQQLNYSGVLEVVRIRREAYPGRVPFLEFYERFELLHKRLVVAAATAATEKSKTSSGYKRAPLGGCSPCTSPKSSRFDAKHRLKLVSDKAEVTWGENAIPGPGDATEAQGRLASVCVLEAFVPEAYYQIGHSRVFLKEEGQDILRGAVRGVYHRMAALIQAQVRGWLGSTLHLRKKEAAIKIHAAARMFILRKRFNKCITKVLLIQRWYRARTVRCKYKGCIASAVTIQAAVRGMQGRQRIQEANASATVIQRIVRGMQGRQVAGQLMMERWMAEEEYKRQELEKQRLRAAALIRAWFLRLVKKFGRRAQNAAATKIQRWVRRRMRGRRLRRNVLKAFQCARDGDVSNLSRVIRRHPHIIFVRNREDRFKTLLHLAATSGSVSVTSLLDPLPADVTAVDSDGNTAFHLAVASCKYEVVKFLASKANNRVRTPSEDKEKESVEVLLKETRATKRISMRIIQEARQATGRFAVRKGGIFSVGRLGSDVRPAAQASKPVFQGFLYKRRETGQWQKRWCVLTEKDMEYYHSKQDYVKGKKPSKAVLLSTALLKKSPPPLPGGRLVDLDHCFELHSGGLLGDKKNKEGRLYFKAKTEEELHSWLVPLRVLAGSHNLSRVGAAGVVRFLDTSTRKELVNVKNKAGETPLFFAARDLGQGRTEANTIARVQIGTWLVENGCDVNTCNTSCMTSLHEALKSGQVPLAAALAKRGGDLTIKDMLGRSCLDLVEGEEDISTLTVGHYRAIDKNPVLPPPVRLSKLTYLSFHLEKLVMQSTAGLDSPFLRISLYNRQGQKLEASQDITAPVASRANYLWWSCTYHMQNPVENLGPGSFITFVLNDESISSGKKRELGWAVFQVNPNTVNTQEVSMEMYRSPVDLRLNMLEPADLFLSGDIHITTAQEDLGGSSEDQFTGYDC